MAAPTSAARRAMLAKIHIALKDLGIPDEDYRAMLDGMFDVASSAKLSPRQLDQLLDHLTKRGFVASKKGDAKPSTSARNRQPMLDKIAALLTELGQLEGRHIPWDYAVGILKRQSSVMRLQWATPKQLRAVIAALDARVGKLTREARDRAKAGGGHAERMPF
ncbi:regulatory protein GemA [Solidesulfovibrio sp.]|uniref:regulatory protein GemA n=1 Tax=Solidesulfovibrio sp. TaxID=2910990 RepID=UPI002B21641E|nr:regulatory protein GemA [Solidesulfovibrio sp.]MEA5087285.1 regulatory protein GemA [Solidesulfovibrio sp.]